MTPSVFDNSNTFKVTFGSISRRNPSVGHVVVKVKLAIWHPAYNASAITNDIAILKLVSNVALNGMP
jgi:hypothetical protein